MRPELETVLKTALTGGSSSSAQIAEAFGVIMDGQADPIEIASLLTALALRGETSAELAGAAAAMKARATRIPTRTTGLLDTCGTGGDQLHTFNISTAAAIVASAAESTSPSTAIVRPAARAAARMSWKHSE